MIKVSGISLPKACGKDCIFCRFNFDTDLWECNLIAENIDMDINLLNEAVSDCAEHKIRHPNCPVKSL